MDDAKWAEFQSVLDEKLKWPNDYQFRFIVKAEQAAALELIFADVTIKNIRPSKGDKYLSYVFTLRMDSSAEVIAIYKKAGVVPGIISL